MDFLLGATGHGGDDAAAKHTTRIDKHDVYSTKQAKPWLVDVPHVAMTVCVKLALEVIPAGSFWSPNFLTSSGAK
jgi:hypothetical protein